MQLHLKLFIKRAGVAGIALRAGSFFIYFFSRLSAPLGCFNVFAGIGCLQGGARRVGLLTARVAGIKNRRITGGL